ncbi:MAG TPA: UDP-glucose--hexose-1-phosphate uridylyltransferase [Anaerolineales bacterium]|nr:UDP-glucose--hexose-1-phosphate uridylyltransferase [Anaerolineales bacterium]
MTIDHPHRRYNPLTGEWVLVSPHRASRPWLGQVEKASHENLPAYDPDCYLCPGNERAGGKRNPEYTGTFLFDNDFPALLSPGQISASGDTTPSSSRSISDPRANLAASAPIFVAQPEYGICRVVCFSPRHDLTLPELDHVQVEAIVQTWIQQTVELESLPFCAYVQIFENKGDMMGASNPHPHSQIWASSNIPTEPAKELAAQQNYLSNRGSCLLCDYLAAEKAQRERLVVANQHFTGLVPYWATWPFEMLIISNRHLDRLVDLTQDEVAGLADLLRQVTIRYDNLFEISFPYSMGFHQSPADGKPHPETHLHAHYYPPLLRSPTVRKFMVGYEMLAMPQRDLSPENAAERLYSLSDQHYKRRPS